MINNSSTNFKLTRSDFIDELYINEIPSDIDGVFLYELKFIFKDCDIHQTRLVWKENAYGVESIFTPLTNASRKYYPSYRPTTTYSSIFLTIPMVAAISRNDECVLNVSISDCLHSTSLSIGSMEYGGLPEVSILFFKNYVKTSSEYKVTLRIDRRKLSFSDSLAECRDFIYKLNNIHANVPNDAYMPLYSTWYNFHRDIYQDELMK